MRRTESSDLEVLLKVRYHDLPFRTDNWVLDFIDIGADALFGPLKEIKHAKFSTRVRAERIQLEGYLEKWNECIDSTPAQLIAAGLEDNGNKNRVDDDVLRVKDCVLVKPGILHPSELI